MPRLVRHEATAPIKIEPQDKPVFICACGLSQELPFCDGAHKGCKAEDPKKLYVYDKKRKRIVEERED
ncbi:MAG: CDGSH iron-sulfur domain-containing protein [Phycisphaerales bacterium]|nr:CDGSH iron-sulfur domain-containing protein [Phycisphaerales bacterium]